MATVSYDGQSFLLDGRRVWLVSGAIHYPRTPRDLWRSRIRAAKQAGLNCIETYVFWNLHEPQPGRFDFEGEKDLRHFVELIAEEGMFCILRPGPYVCSEWDMGGLPAWLKRMKHPKTGEPVEVKLRQSDPLFLETASRYITAVMQQVRDLQVTSPIEGLPRPARPGNAPGAAAGGFTPGQTGGGPILMMQAENEWFCANPDEADAYLRETVRWLREGGCTVPINNCNNLWQRMDGTIDCWNGSQHLAEHMRQLAVLQPNAPRLVTEYWPGWFDQWGGKHADTVDAGKHLYRMAGQLAVGSQYNIYMFHGGTNFAFWGGRTVNGLDCFMTTSYDYDAPLLEAGGRGEKYLATKRISTFASQFGAIFAHLKPDEPHAACSLNEANHPLSVIHQRGSQGDVVFLLKTQSDKTRQVDLMLPDGVTLPVPLDGDRAAWLLLDANLTGVATLNYTNLRPWAFVDRKMLVLFGPAGAEGVVCIDDQPTQVKVPAGKTPHVHHQGPVTVVVLNRAMVDAAYPCEHGLAVGAAGVDDEGQPLPVKGSTLTRIDLDGNITKPKASPRQRPAAPRLGSWRIAELPDLLDGSSDAFQPIDGPASLETLGQDYGYGWYRFNVSQVQAERLFIPESGDRLHLYSDGKLQTIVGLGAGAEFHPVKAALNGEAVVLADNLGRFNYGQYVGRDIKGLAGHLFNVSPVKLPKARIVPGRAPDPFELEGYVTHRRKGDRPPADALVWEVKPAGRKPMVFEFDGFPLDAVVLINGQPIALYAHANNVGSLRLVLTPGERGFTGGKNELCVALYQPFDKSIKLDKTIKLYQAADVLTGKSNWAFAKWTTPPDEAFREAPKTTPARPSWYRGTFTVADRSVPLWLEPRGMSKGQLHLNGHDLGRYWVATANGKAVGPQKHWYLPEPWLKDGDNELTLFDEHGKHPAKCRLLYNPMGPHHT